MSEVMTQSQPTTAPPAGTALIRALPALGLGAAALGIALWNPTDFGPPMCVSKRVFDIDCPMCGGLRCVNSLVRGDLLAAADHNVILAFVLPLIAVAWIAWFLAPFLGRRLTLKAPPKWVYVVATALVLVFTLVRNLDGPAWMDWLASGAYG